MNLPNAINYIFLKLDRLFSSRSTVLTYHSVSDGETPISVSTDDFRKQMDFLKKSGRDVISIREYLDGKQGILITFDDAFKDVYTNALPILKENDFPAVIFVNSSLVGGVASFATLERDRSRLICSIDDLRQLANNKVAIANHSHSHKQLSGLAQEEVLSEYEKTFSFIKNNFVKNSYPDVFVFPKGAKNEQVKSLLRSRGAKILDDRIDIYSDTSITGFTLKLSRSYLWLRDKLSRFKIHKFIFVAALIIGLLIVAPTISAIWKIGSDFKGIYPMFSNDEDQYLSMTREAYDGHYNFGSVYLKEYKDAPSLMQPLAQIVLAVKAKILNISVPQLFAINDFLLPFIGVLLLYSLIFTLTESGLISGFFSTFYYLLFISQFNRPINPQLSFLFLFVGLQLIWEIINNKAKDFKRLLILNSLLAINFGIAFYIYPFVWSAIFVVYCLVLFALVIREREIVYYIKNFLAFSIPSAIFALPFILNMIKASADVNYTSANLRFGFIFSHLPSAYFNVGLMVIGLLILYFSGRNYQSKTDQPWTDKKTIFGFSLAFSGIILNWQNVITGKAFSFSMHYYWVVVLFLLIICSICLSRVKKSIFAVTLIIISLFGLIYKESGGVREGLLGFINPLDISEFRERQKLALVADWFDKNSPHDSAIYQLGESYTQFIPIYTYNNDFHNANAGVYLISDDELENRFVIQNFFTPNINAEYIERYSVAIWTNKFIERYQNQRIRNKIIGFLTGKKIPDPVFIPKEDIDRVLTKIDAYKKLGFEKSLQQYSVDYILLDKNDKRYGYLAEEFKKMPFLFLVTEMENNLIFKVNQ